MKSRIHSITIFILIVLAVLGALHFAIYEAVVQGFFVTSLIAQFVLRIIFVVLSVSFVGASFLAAVANTFFSRWLYRIGSVWLGLATYLFFASVTYFIVTLFVLPAFWLAPFLFLVAACASIYGLIHAQNVRVQNISITLQHLPESWKGKKMVFVSDLHLGQIWGENFTQKIVKKIKEIDPAIVCLGGDVYDGVKVDAIRVVQPFSELKIPLGIFFVTGNHEEFSDTAAFLNVLKGVGIRVLMDEVVTVEDVDILGVDCETTDSAEGFKKVLDSMTVSPVRPSILLKHIPHHIDIAREKGISLQLSGHTHSAQLFPLSLLTPYIFKGFDYGLKTYKNMQVYTSSGVGTWGPPMRVGTDSEIVVITFE